MKAPHTLRLALGALRQSLTNLELGIDECEGAPDDDGRGSIFDRVIAAMQEAEEIGGPENDDYATLMDQIAREASHRAKVCRDRMAEEWATLVRMKEAHLAFPVGARVVLAGTIDRFPHFMVKAGATGVVTVSDERTIAVKMDDHVKGAEEWDNEIVWYDGDRIYAREDLILGIPYAVALPQEERA